MILKRYLRKRKRNCRLFTRSKEGHNDNWKQQIELGRRNNQNFVQIAFDKIIQKVAYKAEEVGITLKEQEESHTSKCSFLDKEPVEHHDSYIGRRIRRGLFRTAKGLLLNADVNASYNIISTEYFSRLFPMTA